MMIFKNLLSCNPQRVVQVCGQVGALPFDVVGGPGVQRVLGHGILNGRRHVSVLLPGADGEDGEERKHDQSETGPSCTRHTLKPQRPHALSHEGS